MWLNSQEYVSSAFYIFAFFFLAKGNFFVEGNLVAWRDSLAERNSPGAILFPSWKIPRPRCDLIKIILIYHGTYKKRQFMLDLTSRTKVEFKPHFKKK